MSRATPVVAPQTGAILMANAVPFDTSDCESVTFFLTGAIASAETVSIYAAGTDGAWHELKGLGFVLSDTVTIATLPGGIRYGIGKGVSVAGVGVDAVKRNANR